MVQLPIVNCRDEACRMMIAGLTLFDLMILIGALATSVQIGRWDWKQGEFPCRLWIDLSVCGVAWCIVQQFLPIALLPLGVSVLLLLGINRFYKPIIGGGDLLLLLTSGLFLPMSEIGVFLILCSICGGLVALIHRRYHQSERIPFTIAILVALWLNFFLYLWS